MRFSVIIPARNRAKQLMLTLASFEKQTYPMDQFEVVVVNDAPPRTIRWRSWNRIVRPTA